MGSSPKNTFVFQVPGLPDQHVLFQARSNRYYLNFSEEMSGKIAHKDEIVGLSELSERGDATRKGPHFVLPLHDNNRGKIVIDDLTVLFQFVNAPPESARMLMKQDFRPRLLDEDDPVFLGFLALFSSIATVMMIWAVNQEPVESVSLDQIPDRFVEMVIPSDPDPDPVDVQPEEDPNVDGPQVEQPQEDPQPQPEEAQPKEAQPERPMSAAEREQANARRLQQKKEALTRKSAVLAMIGTRGEANNGSSVQDVFADGDGGFQDLNDALSGVDGTQTATTENMAAVRGATDGGGRGDATVEGIKKGGTGNAAVAAAPKPTAPKGNISLGGVSADGAEGADGIKRVLRQKQGQVKYCYEQRLKENPNISGRIAVEVYIEGGRVMDVSVVENSTKDKALASCVTRKIRSWRFGADAEGDIYLPFALSSN
ncbi:MAG: AgmX/PglI C-terminal domain-containing protein [Myxococcota bacterium]